MPDPRKLTYEEALDILGRRVSKDSVVALKAWKNSKEQLEALVETGERSGERYDRLLAQTRAYKKLAGAQLTDDLKIAYEFNSLGDYVTDEHGDRMDDVEKMEDELEYLLAHPRKQPASSLWRRLLGKG